jgi:hypothetical protein
MALIISGRGGALEHLTVHALGALIELIEFGVEVESGAAAAYQLFMLRLFEALQSRSLNFEHLSPLRRANTRPLFGQSFGPSAPVALLGSRPPLRIKHTHSLNPAPALAGVLYSSSAGKWMDFALIIT